MRDWLSHTLQADIYVGAPGPGFARPERRIDAAVVADLVRVPGVAGYSASRRAMVDSDHGPLVLDALDLTPALRAGVDLTAGTAQVWQRFADGAVLLAQPLAYRLNLNVGSALQLATAQGPRSFQVAGVFREYGNDRGSVRISRAVYRRLWQDDSVSALALYLAPGADADAVVRRLYAADGRASGAAGGHAGAGARDFPDDLRAHVRHHPGAELAGRRRCRDWTAECAAGVAAGTHA